MFRQTKKRISKRRNFNEIEVEPSSAILGRVSDKQELEYYKNMYPCKLSFYSVPPVGEITLEQFEIWAIDRLTILLELESLISRNKNMKEMELVMKPLLVKLLPLNEGSLNDLKKDYYSHFILRLCFCRSKELRDKFIRSETFLFKLRFNMLMSHDQMKFIESLDLPFLKFIDDEEKQQIEELLYQSILPSLQFQLNIADETSRKRFFKSEKFVKLPFESVIELVGTRQIFIKRGWAYLPQFQQLNHLSNVFAERLMSDLMKVYQNLPKLNEDDRLLPILKHLSSGYVITGIQDEKFDEHGDITANSILSPDIQKHFPLCVINLMDGLNKNHHLKYQGRQQLSFFLKGIGLSIEEGLKFWSESFTKNGNMSLDKFNKEYRYNFRHNYGLEGNRINYKPWDCRVILSKPRPSRGEYHGCPYRDWNPDKLSISLSAMNLTNTEISSVIESCQRNEFTIACTKVFEIARKQGQSTITDQTHITHPNLYYDRSRTLE